MASPSKKSEPVQIKMPKGSMIVDDVPSQTNYSESSISTACSSAQSRSNLKSPAKRAIIKLAG